MTVRILIPAISTRTMVRCLFLTIGIACLGLYSGAWLERELYQAYESRAFDRMTQRDTAGPTAAAEGQIVSSGEARREKPKPASPAKITAASAVIGRLSVQRLHLSAMVREGVDRHTLQLAVGHIPATPLPGQVGNVGVAGHRDTFFRGLKDLKTGDEIQFSTLDGEFQYIVESMTVVEPDDVGVLAASAANVLTLVTCYPFSYVGNAPRRFIVRARQVSSPGAPPLIVE